MPSPLPSRTECWALLRDAAPPAWVLEHVACVESLAIAMAQAAAENGHEVDVPLVHAGAILHDIGRALTQEPKHAHMGAELLRGRDMDARIVDVVERHTGAGITAEDAPSIGVPVKDYTPQTLEQQIVAHADNLHSGTRRLTLEDVRAKYVAKDLLEAFARIEVLHEHLQHVCGVNLEALEPADLPVV